MEYRREAKPQEKTKNNRLLHEQNRRSVACGRGLLIQSKERSGIKKANVIHVQRTNQATISAMDSDIFSSCDEE